MSVLKGDNVGKLHDISCENRIPVTNIIIKEMVKLCMVKPKVLLRVLLWRLFMYTSKYVFTYYTLYSQEYNYGNKFIETVLRELMRN